MTLNCLLGERLNARDYSKWARKQESRTVGSAEYALPIDLYMLSVYVADDFAWPTEMYVWIYTYVLLVHYPRTPTGFRERREKGSVRSICVKTRVLDF